MIPDKNQCKEFMGNCKRVRVSVRVGRARIELFIVSHRFVWSSRPYWNRIYLVTLPVEVSELLYVYVSTLRTELATNNIVN